MAKKKVKPISAVTAIIFGIIALALMGVFVVYLLSSGGEGEVSDISIDQSFEESSLEPPPESVEVKETMADAEVGDAVVFGSYEQDGKQGSAEPIEWIVLEKQEDKLLLISRYCLDTVSYNDERSTVAWSDSSLYAWLNGEFLNNAFSADEASSVLENGGARASMLSAEEALKYYEYDSWRVAAATDYAVSKGARVQDGKSWWWLTDAGEIEGSASYIHFDGTIRKQGFAADYNLVAVRPVIWVSADTETEEISETASEISE